MLNTVCGTPYHRARYGPRAAVALGLLLLVVVWRTERSVWHRLGGLPSWEDGDGLHHHLSAGRNRCRDLFAEGNSPTLARKKKFDLSGCGFRTVPPHFPWEQMFKLTELDVSDNQLSLLPDAMEGLPQLRILLLGMNQFTAVPQVVRTLPALEVLGMQGNSLASLGEDELPPKITQLLLSDNRLRAIPASVSRLHYLRRLALSGNELEVVPAHVSYIDSLEALGLAGNRLRQHGGLPEELFKLPRLSWITVAANQWPLAALAAESAVVPKMEASRTIDARHTQVLLQEELRPAAAVQQVGHAFANSAVQYRLYNASVAGESVLLKVFKASAPTRLSKEEALIHELVGPHENLEGVVGVVMHLNVSADTFKGLHVDVVASNYQGGLQYYSTTHSGDSQDPSASDQAMQSSGLLLRRPTGRSRVFGGDPVDAEQERQHKAERIQRHKQNVRDTHDWMANSLNGLRPLADHPTILKPLRSQYPHRRRFSLGFIMRVLQGVCAALEHLHKHQISHGAVAAHRVLVDGEQLTLREHGHEHDHLIEVSPTGPVLLTDLSAAFSYATATAGSANERGASAGDFERLEVRSFGLLISELQSRYDARRAIDDQGDFDSATKSSLNALSATARNPIVAHRPTFAELRVSLETIKQKALPEGDWYQHSHETHSSPWIAG